MHAAVALLLVVAATGAAHAVPSRVFWIKSYQCKAQPRTNWAWPAKELFVKSRSTRSQFVIASARRFVPLNTVGPAAPFVPEA